MTSNLQTYALLKNAIEACDADEVKKLILESDDVKNLLAYHSDFDEQAPPPPRKATKEFEYVADYYSTRTAALSFTRHHYTPLRHACLYFNKDVSFFRFLFDQIKKIGPSYLKEQLSQQPQADQQQHHDTCLARIVRNAETPSIIKLFLDEILATGDQEFISQQLKAQTTATIRVKEYKHHVSRHVVVDKEVSLSVVQFAAYNSHMTTESLSKLFSLLHDHVDRVFFLTQYHGHLDSTIQSKIKAKHDFDRDSWTLEHLHLKALEVAIEEFNHEKIKSILQQQSGDNNNNNNTARQLLEKPGHLNHHWDRNIVMRIFPQMQISKTELKMENSYKVLRLLFDEAWRIGGAPLVRNICAQKDRSSDSILMLACRYAATHSFILVLVLETIKRAGGDAFVKEQMLSMNGAGSFSLPYVCCFAGDTGERSIEIFLDEVYSVGGSALFEEILRARTTKGHISFQTLCTRQSVSVSENLVAFVKKIFQYGTRALLKDQLMPIDANELLNPVNFAQPEVTLQFLWSLFFYCDLFPQKYNSLKFVEQKMELKKYCQIDSEEWQPNQRYISKLKAEVKADEDERRSKAELVAEESFGIDDL